MSRRNSASRRRSYGRRLHEMHERRQQRHSAGDWLDDADPGAGEMPVADGDHAAFFTRREIGGAHHRAAE
jgi:hypothetical protein